jgi:DNA-binding transcriptional ArsR family regulator
MIQEGETISIAVGELILNELRKMNKILALSNGSKLELEIAKYATTAERKMIWGLIDGEMQAPQIASRINKTKRSVDHFLQILEDAELLEKRKYGRPPKRTIEFVPAQWTELLHAGAALTLEQATVQSQAQTEPDDNLGENSNG